MITCPRGLRPSGKIGGASTMLKQKTAFLFGIVFGLHYLCKL